MNGDELEGHGGATIESHGRPRPGRRVAGLGGLAAAAAVAALIAATLLWRSSPAPAASASQSAPLSADAASPATSAVPNTPATWTDGPVTVYHYGRLSSGVAWATGSADGQTTELYVTTDGGSTWGTRPMPSGIGRSSISGVEFTDAGHAFVAATEGSATDLNSVVLRSADGGRTWTKSAVLEHTSFQAVYLDMFDSARGWLVRASDYSASPDALMATTDGGRTWKEVLGASSNVTNP